MSKERLEEAKEWLGHIEYLATQNNTVNSKDAIQEKAELMGWLIEQAKRTQELERIVKEQDDFSNELHNKLETISMLDINKREDRESIKEISSNYMEYFSKALEGEK